MEKYHHPHDPGYEAQKQKKEEVQKKEETRKKEGKRFRIFYETKKNNYHERDYPPSPKDKLLKIHDLELYNEKFIQPLVDRIQMLEEELCRLRLENQKNVIIEKI